MLKKRIAATLVMKNGIVVQSIGFKKYLPVGKPEIAVEFLNQWGIDEIIMVDISATRNQRHPDYEMVKRASRKCQVPLSVGGGITNIDCIKELMHCGADKVSFNQATIYNERLLTEAAHIFGDQCVVASIDAVKTTDGYKVYDYLQGKFLDMAPWELAAKAQNNGAGEILINSVNRDGSYKGFDTDLISKVCDAVTVPVICAGGAKSFNDFTTVFSQTNVSAAAAANFFHFTEHSVITTKSRIKQAIDIRLETHADYSDADIDANGRLRKKDDDVLENMLYIKIEKEVI